MFASVCRFEDNVVLNWKKMSRFCICICYWDILVFAPGIYLYLQRKHELFLMRGACWSTKGGVDYSPTLPVTGSSLPCYHWYINGNAKRVTTYKETYMGKNFKKWKTTKIVFFAITSSKLFKNWFCKGHFFSDNIFYNYCFLYVL